MTTAIDLPPDIEHRLDRLAARSGRSRIGGHMDSQGLSTAKISHHTKRRGQ